MPTPRFGALDATTVVGIQEGVYAPSLVKEGQKWPIDLFCGRMRKGIRNE